MGRGRNTFKQRDVMRALKAARALGIELARLEITPDGKIALVPGKQGEEPGAQTFAANEWDGMNRIRLKYVNAFRDRHGRLRTIFGWPGCKDVLRLPGLPGSAEFMETYQAAISGRERTRADKLVSSRTKPGTIAAFSSTVAYFNSQAFQTGAAETKRTRRNILERFRAEHGDKQVALLQQGHIQKLVNSEIRYPICSTGFLHTFGAVLQFSVEIGMRADNPAVGVKRVKIKTDGYRSWSEDDIKAI